MEERNFKPQKQNMPPSKNSYPRVVHIVAIIVGTAIFILGYVTSHIQHFKATLTLLQPPEPVTLVRHGNFCPSVLDNMTQGHWKTRGLTPDEQKTSEDFFHMALNHKGVPPSFQRPDSRCGDIGFPNVTGYVRAMCNPTGPTPCCYNFKCVKKTEEQCKCKNCWDLRQQVLANFSKWIPSDERCGVKQHSTKQSCKLLDGASIYFAGDSLNRHMYTAFQMIMRGSFIDGAIKTSATKSQKTRCSGMATFEEKYCRHMIDRRPPDVCGGKVHLQWLSHFLVRFGKNLKYFVTEALGQPRSLFVICIGMHAELNATKVQMEYFKSTLEKLRKVGTIWPKLIFVNIDSPGIMKTLDKQQAPMVKKYNREMEKYLKNYNIPVLNTFDLTHGVRSFDGTHYALGVNRVKARILLNYIQELQDTGQW